MTAVSVITAQKNLYQLISDVNENSTPVTIINEHGRNAVLLSEDDWNNIQETLYISSIPGMTESIIQAGQESSSECTKYNPVEDW